VERSGTGLLGVCFNESEDDGENMLAVSATVGPFCISTHASQPRADPDRSLSQINTRTVDI
jgi:hypothetical protein